MVAAKSKGAGIPGLREGQHEMAGGLAEVGRGENEGGKGIKGFWGSWEIRITNEIYM